MNQVVEYHEEIPSTMCNIGGKNKIRLEARLVATIQSHGQRVNDLKFRIEEELPYEIQEKLNGQSRSRWDYKMRRVIGESRWGICGMRYSIHPPLPKPFPGYPAISQAEFITVMQLLATPGPHNGEIIGQYFRMLEVYPAYETGKSWIKDIMPEWFRYLMQGVEHMRLADIREIMEQ
jgi:hypothetical protein